MSLCRESRRVGWAKTKQNKKRKTSSKTRISKLIKFQSALAFSSGPRRDKKKKKEFGFSGFGNRAKCVSRSFQRERYSLKKVFLEQQQKQQNWPFTENVTFQRKRYCSNRMLLFKENVTSQKRTLLSKENVTFRKRTLLSKELPFEDQQQHSMMMIRDVCMMIVVVEGILSYRVNIRPDAAPSIGLFARSIFFPCACVYIHLESRYTSKQASSYTKASVSQPSSPVEDSIDSTARIIESQVNSKHIPQPTKQANQRPTEH